MDKKSKKEINLGSIEKIPLGQGHCFIVGSEEVAVFRPRAGGLFAIQNKCPHRAGPLAEGVCDSHTVICPYHGHKFDLKTGAGSESGEQVKTFNVIEKNGELFFDAD